MAGQLSFCHTYRRDVLKGIHKDSDTYKMAVFDSAAALSAATTHYDPANEVAGAGYPAGGVVLTGFVATIRGGNIATLDFDNPSIDPSSIAGRYILIYNDSLVGKDAVAVGDLGADITSVNGPWSPGFPAPGAGTSMLQW